MIDPQAKMELAAKNRKEFWIHVRDEERVGRSHGMIMGILGFTELASKSVVSGDSAGQEWLAGLLDGAINGDDPARDGDCFWLIDEALAMDWISMASLAEETHFADADWVVYSLGGLDHTTSSNPRPGIARLKAGLARKILDVPDARRCLMDHGLSAAVSAVGEGITVLEWCKYDSFRRFFRPGFPNCTVMGAVPGIHYPVPDPSIHEAICLLNLDLAERLGSLVQPYTGNKSRGWFVEDSGRWMHWFGRTEASKVLEVGATDGISTNAMLDLLFPDPESEIHAVRESADTDSPESGMEQEHFQMNAAAGGHTRRIHLYTGQSVEVLAWMISEEGYWESFDFIHFKPPVDHVHTLTAVGQAWSLLKPGGVILLDPLTTRIGETHPAKYVMETCARFIGNQADSLLTGDLIALKKRPALGSTGEN